MAVSYLHLVVVAGSGIACFIWILLRLKSRYSRPTRLQLLLARDDLRQKQLYIEHLVPLMVYEEVYPSFGEILALVLDRFTLTQLLEDESLRSALSFLRDSVCQSSNGGRIKSAMCQIVRGFVGDPDIEYVCRPQLSPLVDRFLDEINDEAATAAGSGGKPGPRTAPA
ncbi:MAG: hypothetical protein ACE5JX_15980 [Acidobacteriota bacterium]